MSILDPITQDEQAEFFKQCFSKFSTEVAAKLANEANLIFERPQELWPSQKIVVEYCGKRHFYPVTSDTAKSLAAAADTLVYEYTIGGKF